MSKHGFYPLKDLNKLAEIYIGKYEDASIAFAHISVEYSVRPCNFNRLQIPYCKRKFFRYLKSIRRGGGDGVSV
jgi:hypothetical protein